MFVLKFHTNTGDFVTKQRPNSLCYKYILAMKLVALHAIGVFPVLYCENSFILLSFAFLIVKDMQMQRAEKLYYSCTFLQVPVPTLQALELATLLPYFSAMSGVLALKTVAI